MAKQAKTWWGQRFLAALEGFTHHGRLQRGKSYSSDRRILAFEITDGTVTATVRGNINPYFGVYTEPRYHTKIRMAPIQAKRWDKAIEHIGANAAIVAKLLMHEMPEDIDTAFASAGAQLLPSNRKDFALTQCSCPDTANPCKHIAGVYNRLAARLDRDPFLLFELRGIGRERLLAQLAKTPLGAALSELMAEDDTDIPIAQTLFTPPEPMTQPPDYQAFWHAKRRVPTSAEPPVPAAVPAIPIKKGGDNPAFWDKDISFIEVMEELQLRVREKNKDVL